MKKLFVKLWLLILLTLFVSYQLQVSVMENWRMDSRPMVGSDERARRMMVLVEAILIKYPESEWPQQIDKLKQDIGSPEIWLGINRLSTLTEVEADPRLSSQNIEKLRKGEYQSVIFSNANGFDIFQRMANTEYVLVLSGPTAQRWPVLVFGIFKPSHVSWFIESSIFAVAIFFWVRLFRKDLLSLEAASIQLGAGNFDTKIKMQPGSVLFPLADSFNRMTTKISHLIDSHWQLTNAVSHELRTPISRLRFRYELALAADSISAKDRELVAMDTAIDQLDELTAELLEYAKLNRGDPQLDISIIDVEDWLTELIAEGKDFAHNSKREINIQPITNLASIHGDYRYLSRAVANLIRNAIRYTNSKVIISVERVQTQYVVTVDDDGIGIPIAEREHLFEPFTRLDKSRDRASGGFGIGLAIVKQVAYWHGGTAQIGDANIGGARLQIAWPTTSNVAD